MNFLSANLWQKLEGTMPRNQSGQMLIELGPAVVVVMMGMLGFIHFTNLEWMRFKAAQIAFEDAHAKLLGRAERFVPKNLEAWRKDMSKIGVEAGEDEVSAWARWTPGKIDERVTFSKLAKVLQKPNKL